MNLPPTERLSDPQLYGLLGMILALGFAGLVTVAAGLVSNLDHRHAAPRHKVRP
jgi:hypothetical protein